MLRHMGWLEAADLVVKGISGAITNKTVTFDFANEMDDATAQNTPEFGERIIENM